MSDLPPSLSPFATNHPAGTAYRVTMSTCEWAWTQAEQEAMARAVVELDAARASLGRQLDDLHSGKTIPLPEDDAHALAMLKVRWLACPSVRWPSTRLSSALTRRSAVGGTTTVRTTRIGTRW